MTGGNSAVKGRKDGGEGGKAASVGRPLYGGVWEDLADSSHLEGLRTRTMLLHGKRA